MPRISTARILAVFAIAQIATILFFANGLSGDEGIYAVAGMRILDGRPEDYSGWVNGSMYVWPILSGVAWKIGGLVATRLLALACAVTALACAARIARRLIDEEAATWAVFALAANGTVFALAHLSVYDLPALAALSLSQLCLVENLTSPRRSWVVAGAAAAAVSVIAKFGYVFMLPAGFAVLLATRNGRSRGRQALEFAVVCGAIVAMHNLLALHRIVPASFGAYQAAVTNVDHPVIALQQLYYVLPLGLALLGLRQWRREGRDVVLGWVPFVALLTWPLFHLAVGSPQSANKHTVASALLAAPLAGLFLSRITRRRPLVVAAMLAWGALQWATHEYSWSDLGPAARLLAAQAVPGEAIYTNNGAHRLLPVLYAAGLASTPQRAPIDTIEQGTGYPADAVWIVWEERDGAGSLEVRHPDIVSRFDERLRFPSTFVGASDGLPFGLHTYLYRVMKRR